ncbi:NosD domain-containing protein [Methanomassiliicoccus luminyensis]|uniref:NosD domain-containing protein n=1 Tax=Methanomassiliicoccus luminyensis TaxID=1080712 RepID=UPI00035EAEEF|nr:NosD domain-containing protein [Methanomassiliicoccus luminyensis]
MNHASKRNSIIAAMTLITSIIALSGATATTLADDALAPHDVICVDSDAELEDLIQSEGWDGSGTALDPYIIENLDINATGCGAAIYIGNTTAHLVIRGCTLYDADYVSDPWGTGTGLTLYNVKNTTIGSNKCNGNAGPGMKLQFSDDNIIANNNCSGSNYHGIYLRSSNNNVIKDNNCSGDDSGTGILLSDGSDDNFIEKNMCSGDWQGIFIEMGSDGNTIVNNSLIGNLQYGVVATGSSGNIIYGNIFKDNIKVPQAVDISGTNYWNSSSYPYYGNYWSDWTSPDLDKDGIVDAPYDIDHGSSQDLYPLALESFEVKITSPACCSVVHTPTVLVTGTATPGYGLIINGLQVIVGNDGTFSAVVALLEGDNTIKARSMGDFPEVSSSVHVTYVDQQQKDLDRLQGQVDDLNEALEGALSDLNVAQDDLSSTQKELSEVKGDSLPLVLGAVGLIVGITAVALSLMYARRPKAP